MPVRVKVKIKSLKGKEVITSAHLNTGFTSRTRILVIWI